MSRLVLHRPYLRADPAAHPESAELCMEACLMLLDAYAVGSRAEASIFWSWWTMSYRVSLNIEKLFSCAD